MTPKKHLTFFLLFFFISFLFKANAQYKSYPSSLASNSVQYYPNNYNVPNVGGFFNVKAFGAKGDGVTDDTQAIQAAMNANRSGVNTGGSIDYFYPRPKTVYFPKGTYLVSKDLVWIGQAMMLMGQGKGETVIKLKNSAYGFTNAGTPKAVIKTPEGIHEFNNYIKDLTVHVGAGNPGAIGIDFHANNTGGIVNVEVKSEDGQGSAGISMMRAYPGPCMLKNISVNGFNYAIKTGRAEYSITFENIVISNQKIAGIENNSNILLIRKLISTNAVPVIRNLHRIGMITILDSELKGGSASGSAIDNVDGSLFARNVVTSGYQSAIKNKGVVVSGTAIAEYVNGTVSKLFPSNSASLNLPIEETPEYHEPDVTKWAEITSPGWYGDTRTWAATINSGKPVIYFKTGTYMANNQTYNVPLSVRNFNGLGSVINGGDQFAMKLVVKEGDENSPPLIIEHFGRGISIEHLCKRPVVIKHSHINSYVGSAQAGKLFLEDVLLKNTLTLNPGQQVWARQFNSEIPATRILNNGGDLWVLGIKTENTGTVIKTTNSGNTELLGGLIYPVKAFSSPEAAFIAEDANQSLVFGASAYNSSYMYPVLVRERRSGVTKEIKFGGQIRYIMPLHVGYVSVNLAEVNPATACPCNVFNATDAPTGRMFNDGKALQVGMKFRASGSGTVTGVRFYKQSGNTGTHTGQLYSSTGKLLAQATFVNETASGWQQVNFSTPVAITANTTYIVSYHSSSGYYSATGAYFNTAKVNGPLTGLKNGFEGGNGLYRYTASPAFASSSYNATNYWVDVVFHSSSAAAAGDITLASGAAASRVAVEAAKTGTTDAQLQFDLFPNPAVDQLNIRNNALQDFTADVAIKNIAGQTVYRASDVVFTAGGIQNFSQLNNLSSGVYLLFVTGEDLLFTKKFIIRK